MNIGLVVEGKDDVELISACIEAELVRLGHGLPNFQQLQPALDATGEIERGGWTKVLGWILNYSGGAISTFFTPILASAPACDAIVIHIDSDINTELFTALGEPLLAGTEPPTDIARAIEVGLRKALLAGAFDGQVVFAVPVHKSENWLMAGSVLCTDNRWADADSKMKLSSLFDNSIHASKAAMRSAMIAEIRASTDRLHSKAESYHPFRAGMSSL